MGKTINEKTMLTHEKIYKIMQWLPVFVASVFFIINLTKGNVPAMIVIGVCLMLFVGSTVIMKAKNATLYVKEFVLALALPLLVFMISLFSGESYSDDFSLFLAVIAMTGMYLEPKFTKIQVILADILLVIMYIVHPEKTESFAQYRLCFICFTLAAILFYQVIKRGRAFIEISQERAEESEKLLESIRSMGAELQRDFDESSAKIELSTQGLQKGSVAITHDAEQVSDSCNVVHDKIKETEEQIAQLNEGVRAFEEALTENRNNVTTMNSQVEVVSGIISESGSTFRTMEEKMKEIAGIAKQISDISFKLTILSLNASVESAHAGESGSGFEVLANEMRELSETSSGFSERVSEVVKELQERVVVTSERVARSEEALSHSEDMMSELVDSFEKLNQQFAVLYGNIECQNRNVNQIDSIFGELNYKVANMQNSSLTNQDAVENIVDAMTEFSEDVGEIVKNTQSI